MKCGKALFVILFAYLTLNAMCYSASATVYPWIQMTSDDIRMVSDPLIEEDLRLKLIGQAQNKIDLVIWDQREDETVGMPVLKALRDAAERGVRIRFLLSWSGHVIQDSFNRVGRFLTTPPARTPIQFLIVGGSPMWKNGWGYLDGIHEKLLVVDHHLAMVTGRGHADQYLQWMDTAFFFRGALVDQSLDAFERLWETVKKETEADTLSITLNGGEPASSPSPLEKLETQPLLPLSESQQRLMSEVSDWMDGVGTPQGPLVRYEARLLHQDFLKQMRDLADFSQISPSAISVEDRLRLLEDPIINEAIRLISHPEAKDFRFYALSVTLHPKLKKAILDKLRRGLSVELFTNGRKAQTDIVPIKIPFGWYLSLPDLDDLLQGGARGIGLVQNDPSSAVYLHRKMAMVDDTVLFGSHNFNLSSSVESDEMDFEIRSPEFADQARNLFRRSLWLNGEYLDADQVHSDRKYSRIAEWFSGFLKGLY